MRDHREGQDPTRLVDITDQLRRAAQRNDAVRTTPPDWRIGRRPRPTAAKVAAKVRRRQAAESRKRNRG